MEALGLLFLIGIFWYARQETKKKRTDQRIQEIIETQVRPLEDLLEWLKKHTPTLLLKKRQLVTSMSTAWRIKAPSIRNFRTSSAR